MSSVSQGARRRHSGITAGRSTHSPNDYQPDPSAPANAAYADAAGKVQITMQDISPGAVGIGSFAGGLAPVHIVNTLPTLPLTAYPEGTLVVLTTNGKLYRNVAGAWSAAVAGDDVVASSIVAGTVTAGALSVAQIVIHDGALTLMDEFGATVLVASGFTGTWASFLSSGLYNADFAAGIPGSLPAGRTVTLPYWTVSKGNTSGTALFELGSSALFPSGSYVRFKPGGTSDYLNLTADPVSVTGFKDYLIGVVLSSVVGGVSAKWRLTVDVLWYDEVGAWIATSTESLNYPDLFSFGLGVLGSHFFPYLLSAPFTAPSNAATAYVTVIVQEVTAHDAASEIRLGLISFKPDPVGLNMNLNRQIRIGNLDVDPTTDSVSVTGTLNVQEVLNVGNTAFISPAVASDTTFRSDHGMWFFYDGTRWLSTTLFQALHSTQFGFISATTASLQRLPMPHSGWDGNVWVEDCEMVVFVNTGGTALGASHKWSGAFQATDSAGVATTLATCVLDSGNSNEWRKVRAAVGSVLSRPNVFNMEWTFTKTGTPGNLAGLTSFSYRLVAV